MKKGLCPIVIAFSCLAGGRLAKRSSWLVCTNKAGVVAMNFICELARDRFTLFVWT
jgi:hypothetical protein